jgi:hypothetical protein
MVLISPFSQKHYKPKKKENILIQIPSFFENISPKNENK